MREPRSPARRGSSRRRGSVPSLEICAVDPGEGLMARGFYRLRSSLGLVLDAFDLRADGVLRASESPHANIARARQLPGGVAQGAKLHAPGRPSTALKAGRCPTAT